VANERHDPPMHSPRTPERPSTNFATKLAGTRAADPSIPKAVVLMNRTPPGMPNEPGGDARVVETTQTLETGHWDADCELLEADGALGRVYAVLLRGSVGKHARPAGLGVGVHRRATPRVPRMRRDANVDVRLAHGFVVGE
jgi:hypothetical protein